MMIELAGRVRVDAMVHPDTDSAVLAGEDTLLFDGCALAIRSSGPEVLITVGGLADPSGSARRNRRPGQACVAGYGEDCDRQAREGATREEGRDNRRVSLVMDQAGPSQTRTISTASLRGTGRGARAKLRSTVPIRVGESGPRASPVKKKAA